MCGLDLTPYEKIPDSTLHRLSSNLPGGVLLPKLEWLRWDAEASPIALTSFRLFLSPHLKNIVFSCLDMYDVPRSQLAGLVQTIPVLPTSLEDLTIMCGFEEEELLKDAISSFICRCGSSLRAFRSSVLLSEAAVHHLMQLPNLRSWDTAQGPPRTLPLSIFPALEELHLEELAALQWLHLLASDEKGTFQNHSTPTTSHANIRETLRSLSCPPNTTIDSTILSSILKFRNLVMLYVGTYCDEAERCTFHLTDGDVENLAITLPRLKSLQLGIVCDFNYCRTTVASLMSISVHCPDLTSLETHFNTLTIVDDMKHLHDGGSGRGNAKCKLRNLKVGYLPLEVRGEDIETLVVGFKVIFPCLTDFTQYNDHWYELRSKLRMYI